MKKTTMASSLRRRLQVWYGVVLLILVLVFGALLYGRIRAMRLSSVDVELTAMADFLDANLRGLPPSLLGGSKLNPDDRAATTPSD